MVEAYASSLYESEILPQPDEANQNKEKLKGFDKGWDLSDEYSRLSSAGWTDLS